MLKYVIGIVVLTGWRLVGRSGGRPRGHGEHRRLYLWEIIEQGLDDMEDCYLAADVLERVRKGWEQTPAAAHMGSGAWLGLPLSLSSPAEPERVENRVDLLLHIEPVV